EDPGFLDNPRRQAMTNWWLAVVANANTPNWDIASTCLVDGKPGLLLIEAKAHHAELTNAEKGKSLPNSDNGWLNHERIGHAIAEASYRLQRATGWRWAISRDSRYQMSNRFAWSWKIASM